MKIHHVGYLTRDLKASEIEFNRLGFVMEKEMTYDPYRKLKISFWINGSYRVELIQPDSQDSPLFSLLKKYKNTPYHFCYMVESLDLEVERLEASGYMLIQKPLEAPCIGKNRRVVFLINNDMGIVELLEQEEKI